MDRITGQALARNASCLFLKASRALRFAATKLFEISDEFFLVNVCKGFGKTVGGSFEFGHRPARSLLPGNQPKACRNRLKSCFVFGFVGASCFEAEPVNWPAPASETPGLTSAHGRCTLWIPLRHEVCLPGLT